MESDFDYRWRLISLEMELNLKPSSELREATGIDLDILGMCVYNLKRGVFR